MKLYKEITKDNLIFKTEAFLKDRYKFYIALKILASDEALIYSNEKDYVIMQMDKNLPIWIWTSNDIKDNLITEIMEIIDLHFNNEAKITCKKEFYDLLLENNVAVNELKSFEMGTLHCEKTVKPKNMVGKMELANESNLNVLAKYWYDDYTEMEDDNYTIEQSQIDMLKMIKEGKFYVLKDENDKIVCMARYTLIDNVASINKVFTPKEERKKGYCANLIYNLSNMLLNEGIVPMLYTDYNYVPSNKAYMNVGYVQDGILVSFYLKKED